MASGITEAVIDEVKSRTDIAELIASYGIEVKHAGSGMKACCPFHKEKTPSFSINPQKGFYHCFGCGESGDAIKFVRQMEGVSFVEAVRRLAERCGVEIVERDDPETGKRRRLWSLMGELSAFYRRCLLQTKEAEEARAYVKKRGLDGETGEAWQIGYAPNGAAVMLKWAEKHAFTPEELSEAGVVRLPDKEGDRGYHRFSGRLMFPIRDKAGRVVAFSGRLIADKKNAGKYVNSPETPIFRKSSVLFGFDKAAGAVARSPHREVICCEGQIDTIRLHACGFANAVASQGTSFTEAHARMVRRVAESAFLMYDDDPAGHKATIRVASLLLGMEMPVRVVALPNGEDPDSFLRKNGADALRALMDKAESIVSFQCRVAKGAESDPTAVDAVARITKSVLSTIACCPSKVLQSAMTKEAAQLLSVPVDAMSAELTKTKPAEDPVAMEDGQEADARLVDEINPPVDEPKAKSADDAEGDESAPVPNDEYALMELLAVNEYDKPLAESVRASLHESALVHPLTRMFLAAWLAECDGGEDLLYAVYARMAARHRPVFERVLSCADISAESAMPAADAVVSVARRLWTEELRRALARNDADPVARMETALALGVLACADAARVSKAVRSLASRRAHAEADAAAERQEEKIPKTPLTVISTK